MKIRILQSPRNKKLTNRSLGLGESASRNVSVDLCNSPARHGKKVGIRRWDLVFPLPWLVSGSSLHFTCLMGSCRHRVPPARAHGFRGRPFQASALLSFEDPPRRSVNDGPEPSRGFSLHTEGLGGSGQVNCRSFGYTRFWFCQFCGFSLSVFFLSKKTQLYSQLYIVL